MRYNIKEMTRRFNISHILFNLSKAMSVFFLVSMMLGYVLLPSQIDTPTVFQPVSVNAATAPRYGYNCNAGITSNGGCLNSLGTGAEASGCILTSTNKTLCANVPESLKNSTNTFYIIDGCDEVICTSGSETFSNCRNGECTVKQTAAQAATGVNTVPVQSYIPGEPKVTRITCQAGIDTASSSTSPRVTVSNCINDSTGELVSRGKPDYCAAWTKNNATQVVLNCRPQAIGFIGSHECLNDRNAAILIVCTPSELIAGDTGEYISVWDEPLDGCYYFLNKLGDAICVTDKDINEVCQTREVNIQTNNTGTNYLIRIAGDIIAERNTARACAKTQAEFINELSNRGYNVVSGIEGFSAELNVATAFDVAACELESLAVGESKECQGQRITKTDDPACLYKTDDGTCYGADGARVQVGDDTSNGDFGLPGVDDLFEALHQIVSIVILLLLIFLGWIAQGLFWIVSLVALTLLQINPAGATFFQVALGPWGIMVSIASIILLSGFVFVGFKYILGSGKSVKVDQFLTNVVIVGVSILFTLFACAGVINLAQGVGDVFLAGYQAASGTSRQSKK